jgi:hypothetical protein
MDVAKSCKFKWCGNTHKFTRSGTTSILRPTIPHSLARAPIATKKPTADPDRAPDLGEGRDWDLVKVLGAVGSNNPHQIPIPNLPGPSRGPGPYFGGSGKREPHEE